MNARRLALFGGLRLPPRSCRWRSSSRRSFAIFARVPLRRPARPAVEPGGAGRAAAEPRDELVVSLSILRCSARRPRTSSAAPLPGPLGGAHADRAAAGAAAVGGRHRALAAFSARALLIANPLAAGLRLAFTDLGGHPGGAVRLEPVLPAPGDRRVRDASTPTCIDAARTLGAGPARTFVRIALPLAARRPRAGPRWPSPAGIGEFGATIMFAGNFQGPRRPCRSRSTSCSESDFDTALALGALLVVFSAAILLTVKLLSAWTRSISTSTSRSATLPFAPTSA